MLIFDGNRYEFNGLFRGFLEGDPPDVSDAEWREAMEDWERFEIFARALRP